MSLLKIQSELKAPKTAYNKFGNYNYRSCEDILEAVKPLLDKYECELTIEDKVNQVGNFVYIESTCLFLDKEGKCYKTTAQAGIEKAGGMSLPQAFGSASSYAKKYALGNLFLIDDTKDSDATNENNAEKRLKECKTVDELGELYKSLSPEKKKELSNLTTQLKNKLQNA